jgi:predicted ABC-type ATPase
MPPRLRLFAGPNGSGKSSLQTVLKRDLLGDIVNPDELEKELKSKLSIDLSEWHCDVGQDQIVEFLKASTLLQKSGLDVYLDRLNFEGHIIDFQNVEVNSYWAAVLSDFIRRQWIEQKRTFSFESVMSSPDKIEFLKLAKSKGYRIYLYFIATVDPELNISRVKARVEAGGHDVPKDKIVDRYHRSIQLMKDAIKICDRSYIFDNSGSEHRWIAEVTSGENLEVKEDDLPDWFAKVIF